MTKPTTTSVTRGELVIWRGLSESEPGAPIALSQYPVKTVTIRGGEARLMGANVDGDDFPITDDHGLPIKGPGMYRVILNPLKVWPVVTSGTDVTVTVLACRDGGL